MDQVAIDTLKGFFAKPQPEKWEAQGIIHSQSDSGLFQVWINPTGEGAGWPVVVIAWQKPVIKNWRWTEEHWSMNVFQTAAEAADMVVTWVAEEDRRYRAERAALDLLPVYVER